MHQCSLKMDVLVNQRRNQLQLMNWQLQLNHQFNENNMLLLRVQQEYRRVQKKRRRRRSVWVRPWIERRVQLGQYTRLMEELRLEDVKAFKNFLRVEPELYEELVERVSHRIWKQDTAYRQSLRPGLKVAITMRYLASGDSYHSLMYAFRVPHNTISKFIPEVCEAITQEYSSEVIACPTKSEEWKAIADQFSARWNFHHCLGALDGKHIAMQCPPMTGSIYYNYKGFFSIILMALVDADYKFTWVDVGSDGSSGDAHIFNASELKECIEDGSIGFPEPEPLPDDDKPMPYFIAADDAFALRTWLMKPYSKRQMSDTERIFNYRLSRARRIVENAFGILAHRWRCLLTTLLQKPETVTSIVMACVCLHNLMRIRYPTLQNYEVDQEENNKLVPGSWRTDNPLVPLRPGGQRQSVAAKHQRDYLSAYYMSPVGSVPWQMDMI